MAVVLREGKIRGDLNTMWVGHEVECPVCDCLFRLESQDKVRQCGDLEGDGWHWETACPRCRITVSFHYN